MKSSPQSYDLDKSVDRIDEILDAPSGNYKEVKSIPSRDSLTFTNGFYVNCTSIYMDIKNSSALPEKHQRPRLAKIYRSFISEAVAILNSSTLCAEVNIHGDAAWAVYEGQYKENIDEAFSVTAKLASLVKIINCRLKKRGIDGIAVGIGADYGRALMIKAGYSGSGINDLVWMGDVVNRAANMCKKAKELSWQSQYICVSSVFYDNLNDDNKKLLAKDYYSGYAHGSVVNTAMEDWWEKNCKGQ